MAIEVPTLEQLRAHVDMLLQRHSIKVEWRKPEGAVAYARIKARTIVTPPIEDETTFCVALHEISHVLAERCSGDRHYRDPKIRDWHVCGECERLAWRGAVDLCRPLTWMPGMQRFMSSSMRYQARTTRMYPEVREGVKALSRNTTMYRTWMPALQMTIAERRALLAALTTPPRTAMTPYRDRLRRLGVNC